MRPITWRPLNIYGGPVANYSTVYWDSSVWIALLWDEKVKGIDRAEVAQRVLEDAEKGLVTILTSTFTLAEVFKLKIDPPASLDPSQVIKSYFDHSFIKMIVLDRVVGEIAGDIARKHGIKPQDAVHLASALCWEAEVVHTWDDQLVSKSGIIGTSPLKIEYPLWNWQAPMNLPG